MTIKSHPQDGVFTDFPSPRRYEQRTNVGHWQLRDLIHIGGKITKNYIYLSVCS